MDKNGTILWRNIIPRSTARIPVPAEVPDDIAASYNEACDVLSVSAKASAALSRRCLQQMLHSKGYKAKTLAQEVDMIISETDPSKSVSPALKQTIDAIRNFGNFSAHPITDLNQLQIIDVEPEEAEWCLEIIEQMFDELYTRPEQARLRKQALDKKLQAAGKPISK